MKEQVEAKKTTSQYAVCESDVSALATEMMTDVNKVRESVGRSAVIEGAFLGMFLLAQAVRRGDARGARARLKIVEAKRSKRRTGHA